MIVMKNIIDREKLFQEIASEIPIKSEKVVYGITFIAGPGI